MSISETYTDDTVPRCVHCGEERYPYDEHCIGCSEEWDCEFEQQPEAPAPLKENELGPPVSGEYETDWGAFYEGENRNGEPKPR